MSNTASQIAIQPEWAPQKAIWTAWPADPNEWNGDLDAPRRDVAAMVFALSEANSVRVLVSNSEAEKSARHTLGQAAEVVSGRYGDIWLRDTGPIFARYDGEPVALRFKTNSWGGKFNLPDDERVGDAIASYAGVPVRRFDFVLEGGAVDHNGEGTFLTTAETLLHPNRNAWTKRQAEAALQDALGSKTVIWLDEGLQNDHTDGHVDNIARFVSPGCVVCQKATDENDPNTGRLDAIAKTLQSACDDKGRKLEVVRIPSVGLYYNALGEISPASHMNFVIANGVVVMPVYGTPSQDAALGQLQDLFPGRKVIGIPSKGLLGCGDAGGGSFHCITQQESL